MHSTVRQSDKEHRKKSFSRWKVFLVGLISVVVIAEWAFVINSPVGDPTIVQGSISQRCVPYGRQGNNFHCTAKLRDGSFQIFTTLGPVETGSPVLFLRYNRRFFGVYYEAKSY